MEIYLVEDWDGPTWTMKRDYNRDLPEGNN